MPISENSTKEEILEAYNKLSKENENLKKTSKAVKKTALEAKKFVMSLSKKEALKFHLEVHKDIKLFNRVNGGL